MSTTAEIRTSLKMAQIRLREERRELDRQEKAITKAIDILTPKRRTSRPRKTSTSTEG